MCGSEGAAQTSGFASTSESVGHCGRLGRPRTFPLCGLGSRTPGAPSAGSPTICQLLTAGRPSRRMRRVRTSPRTGIRGGGRRGGAPRLQIRGGGSRDLATDRDSWRWQLVPLPRRQIIMSPKAGIDVPRPTQRAEAPKDGSNRKPGAHLHEACPQSQRFLCASNYDKSWRNTAIFAASAREALPWGRSKPSEPEMILFRKHQPTDVCAQEETLSLSAIES